MPVLLDGEFCPSIVRKGREMESVLDSQTSLRFRLVGFRAESDGGNWAAAKNYDLKNRVIGGTDSLLCSACGLVPPEFQ